MHIGRGRETVEGTCHRHRDRERWRETKEVETSRGQEWTTSCSGP